MLATTMISIGNTSIRRRFCRKRPSSSMSSSSSSSSFLWNKITTATTTCTGSNTGISSSSTSTSFFGSGGGGGSSRVSVVAVLGSAAAAAAAAALLIETHSDYQERIATTATTTITYTLPRSYDRQAVREYWIRRPVSVVRRVGHIAYELTPVASSYVYDRWFRVMMPLSLSLPSTGDNENHNNKEYTERARAIQVREALTNLGPAFVKAGQQLAIRPDLVPPVMLKELQKLCDSVRPIDDDVALKVIRDELLSSDSQEGLDAIFEDLHLVASASLGQVYKGRLRETGQTVAVKVQRPGMRKAFSIDLFLLQLWGDFMDTFTATFTKQLPFHASLFDTFSHSSYSELDYENEARNQIYFQKQLAQRKCKVKVPDVYLDYSTERVLTTEWIDGEKLADSPKETIKDLIPVGVELFLTQLLDIGHFHSDPHVGNLLVTDDGVLCLLDFGLCAEVDHESREAMTKAIVHLLIRDFDALIDHDTKQLGFLPEDFDTEEIKPILTKVLTGAVLESGSDLKKRKRKLMEISEELNEIFFRFPFQVPPFFALVTRGLGLLEGIALVGDPHFDIFMASAPYASRRAVSLLGRHWTRQSSAYRKGPKNDVIVTM